MSTMGFLRDRVEARFTGLTGQSDHYLYFIPKQLCSAYAHVHAILGLPSEAFHSLVSISIVLR